MSRDGATSSLARSTILTATLGLVVAACTNLRHVQCEQDTNCDLEVGGRCVRASTNNQWCAYPDGACPTGYRYSTEDVEDGVSGTCTEEQFTLAVSIGGSGSGEVIVTPSGLTCAGTCVDSFPRGTQVQLTASATSGAFVGWLDACKGAASCMVTMDRERTVGALFGTRGEELWVNQLGGGGAETGYGVASDANGGVIVVGPFTGTVQIGTETLTSNGIADAFIVKLSRSDGGVIWAKHFGGTEQTIGTAVDVDVSGAIYVGGYFSGDVDFGGGALSGGAHGAGFLVKLDADGNHVWSRQIGGAGSSAIYRVSVNGTVAVTGGFSDSMNVNGTTLTSIGGNDGFVVKLTTDGDFTWAKRFGGSFDDYALGVAVDNSGNVWLTGSFSGTADFGGGPLNSGNSYDIYLAKLAAANGAHLFSKRFGSNHNDSGYTVAVDSANNVVVIGGFLGTVDFGGPSPLVASQSFSTVVAKYTAAGAYLWAKASSGTDFTSLRFATIDQAGDITIADSFCGTISLGGPPLSSASACPNHDIFVSRLSGADGAHLESVRAGSTGHETCGGVTQAPDGRLFITGQFRGSSELAGRTLMSAGESDAFILGLAPL